MSPRMPSETAPQSRIWMAFPSKGYTLGDTAADAHEARSTWAAVAHAALEFEPVTMVVDPADDAVARRYLSAGVDIVHTPLDDAWMRDIGPSFVYDEGRLAGVDWIFNGWGAQDWATWDNDARVASYVLSEAGVPRIESSIVNEGGGFHVDGEGTVLVTETVQLDNGRNPGATKADIEAELARTIGATKVVWLPRGLTRDAMQFGTRGHVDIVATIPSPGVLLLHDQRNPDHPDHTVTLEVERSLRDTTDAAGRSWEIRKMPAPQTISDEEGPVDYSYLNHLVVNGGVIACSFDDPHDAEAVSILTDVYPGRRVVTVDARPLFARGGGVHCITQQQPA
ncbi:agmatine deiminase family protein [Flexivirga meconopsidis]|uniref:agmatine deiminase family protein n=1 Tax=Flexivirga meconopsidis TaxID=2977121 RepID=UPI002240ACBB|nr:agmatine deiminase family protein [Flexivirga meconopsidis]